MSEIKAIFPEHIYCTQQIDKETKDKRHIYNDFSIIIEITGCTQAKKRGDKASTIHIYGLEKLFLTDGQKSIDKTMAQFAALLQAADNPQWNVSYNSNLKSIDITCTARKLDKYSSVKFQLSEQCEFTADLSNNNHVDLSVTSENFNLFCPDLDESKPHNYTIWAQQVAYIDKFAAFEYNPQEQNKENEPQEVKAIHKGDWASIQWDLGNLDHYTASLLDENGERKTNVSPYIVQIDKDRKFTLKVKKDNTIVTQSLNVYRTLWEKVAEGQCPEGFTPDPKGNNKFFYRSEDCKYYAYIHPKLFRSANSVEWEEVSIQIQDKPQDNFINYSCSYYYKNSATDDCLLICYTYNNLIILYEYNFKSNRLSQIHGLSNNKYKSCQAIKRDNNIDFFCIDNDKVKNFDLLNTKTGIFYKAPNGAHVIAADTLSDDKIFLAILCDNHRVYVYDTDNKRINNIFEYEKDNQKNIVLVKTNSIYILLNDYTLELNDKEKFSDMHFMPQNLKNEPLIIGARDKFAISAIVINKDETKHTKKTTTWNYRF